jgi:hypothetical protein
MPTEEAATTDDEESVALRRGHENKEERLIYWQYRVTFFRVYDLYATT